MAHVSLKPLKDGYRLILTTFHLSKTTRRPLVMNNRTFLFVVCEIDPIGLMHILLFFLCKWSIQSWIYIMLCYFCLLLCYESTCFKLIVAVCVSYTVLYLVLAKCQDDKLGNLMSHDSQQQDLRTACTGHWFSFNRWRRIQMIHDNRFVKFFHYKFHLPPLICKGLSLWSFRLSWPYIILL